MSRRTCLLTTSLIIGVTWLLVASTASAATLTMRPSADVTANWTPISPPPNPMWDNLNDSVTQPAAGDGEAIKGTANNQVANVETANQTIPPGELITDATLWVYGKTEGSGTPNFRFEAVGGGASKNFGTGRPWEWQSVNVTSIVQTQAQLNGLRIRLTSLSSGVSRVDAAYVRVTTADTAAPTVSVTTPSDNGAVGDATPRLAGAAGNAPGDSATATVRIYAGPKVAGSPIQTLTAPRSGSTWAVDAGALPDDGTYTAQATQSDAAGNTGLSNSVTFWVNTGATCDRFASPTGSDSNPGTLAAPYRTALKLADSLVAGQTGCFRAGTYAFDTTQNLVVDVPDAALQPYQAEAVTLKGSLRVLPAGSRAVIQGLRLDGRSSTTNHGPKIYADDVILRNNETTNARSGICVQVSQYESDPLPERVLVERNRIHDCGELPAQNHDHGIYISNGRDTVVRDNWIYDNTDRGVQHYPDADGTLVTGNIISGNGQGVNFGGDESNANCSDNNTATGNVITYSNIRWNVYSGAQGIDCSGNVVHNNCVWATQPGYTANGGVEPNSRSFTAHDQLIEEPRYVDRGNKNFRLQASSPCLSKYTGTLSLP